MNVGFLFLKYWVPESWLPEWPRGGILGVFWVAVIAGVRWAPNGHFEDALTGYGKGLEVSTRGTQVSGVPEVFCLWLLG